jgi:hypothetical protein
VVSEPGQPPDAADPPDGTDVPGLDETFRQVGAAGRAAYGSAKDTGRAMRRLFSAELALARSAFGRALAWVAVGIVFGASAWLLVTGALIALLQRLGWSWLQSLSFAAAVSLIVTGVAVWRVGYYFDLTGMHATRRQLSRLGLLDDGDDDEPVPPENPPP